MLCERCQRDQLPPRPEPPWDGRAPARLRGLVCARCAEPLTATVTGPSLLDKLSQLAQFGLTAGVGPLLQPSQAARDRN
jgi:hypothetical protein